MNVVMLVDDLMFKSRVLETARGAGATVLAVPRASSLKDACLEARAELVIVDLDDRRRDAVPEVKRLRAEPGLDQLRVVGFLSHVDTTRVRQARDAGVTRVLARSAFVDELKSLLSAAAESRS